MRSGSWWLLAAVFCGPSALAAEPAIPPSRPKRSAVTTPGSKVESRGTAEDASAPVARALMDEGLRLRKAGADRPALEVFDRAWRLDGSAQALAQVALAEQALGLWVDGYGHLRRALESSSDPWIATHRETLEMAFREMESHVGRLDVACNVDGAEIRVDGRLLGKTPLATSLLVLAGQSVLSVRARGYFKVTREVQVDPSQLARVDVHLTANEAADVPVGAANGSAEETTTARDALMYTSIGLAALGAATGLTGYVMREVNVRVFNDDSRCAPDATFTRTQQCPKEAAAFRRGEVLAISGAAAAGVFGSVGLYLWLQRPDTSSGQDMACGWGGLSLYCAGHF
jgi:PEGA domain-containing protein